MNNVPISERAAGRWPEIYEALAPDLHPALEEYGKHVACPVHGGKDGFRLFDKNERALFGAAVCNTCGIKENGIVVLSWLYGWSSVETIRRVSEVLSGMPPRAGEPIQALLEKAREKKKLDAQRAVISARKWWSDALPATSFKARTLRRYLYERALSWGQVSHRFTDDFRFHPALPYYEGGHEVDRFPALLSLARNADNAVVFMHRTWLAKNGHGKAPVSCARKATTFFHPHQGAAIRLGGHVSSGLHVAEGIETALSVSLATEDTCWSLVNTTLMAQWVPPKGVNFVTIWADKDAKGAGQEAAETLARRLRANELMVSIREPECPIRKNAKSVDWNNVLDEYGPEAFSGMYFWGTP
ncbi:hypothetical protein BW247_05475 [Acidihalobacter ferrooxydans]|uniref:DNA primase/helicase Gp4 N-terminal Bacteriophage T7-like domain-containing protein n=2 Tax=Acidihalobacter ferrooxydans TaxID=1765967 RepID=A0A1P8UFT1_9GAMM|nr:hypothetical protein BW247_05475 [Acidihalobacter ferrooxydans]